MPLDARGMDTVSFADEACAAYGGQPPRVALLLVGNFRTFAEPRVYKSIRRNLIDALGGRTSAFIYGKLDHEHHGAALQTERNKDFKIISYASRLAAVHRAVDYLSAAGGADVTWRTDIQTKAEGLTSLWVARLSCLLLSGFVTRAAGPDDASEFDRRNRSDALQLQVTPKSGRTRTNVVAKTANTSPDGAS